MQRIRGRITHANVIATLALVISLAAAGSAQAAKTYNDPWLEGDLQQMRVPAALDILARTPQHVIVGDIDSGARLTDPDLAPHLLAMPTPYTCASAYNGAGGPAYSADPANGDFGCDFIGEGNEAGPTTIPDGDPTDPSGHGTGTAAIIAAVPNNGIEGAGVAPNARLLPVRACYGKNPDCGFATELLGMTYAVTLGATVVNIPNPPEVDNETTAAFRSFIHGHLNVLFVFPIGGSGQNDEPFPVCTDKATYPNVVCVGLAEPNDTPGTIDAQTTTDVSAPGYAGVPSASGMRAESHYTDGAAAHVSGAAALLRGLAPNLNAAAIREVLVATSRPVAGYSTANKAGGIVDVETAVRAVQGMEGLITPAEGHGAAADSPDPFPGQTAPEATTTSPPATSPPATTPAPGAPTKPNPAKPGGIALSLKKLPHSIAAGTTLKLHLDVTGGTGTVTAKLTDHKKTLAKASKKNASGNLTVALRLPRGARRGPAKLTVRIAGAKPIVKAITVTRPT